MLSICRANPLDVCFMLVLGGLTSSSSSIKPKISRFPPFLRFIGSPLSLCVLVSLHSPGRKEYPVMAKFTNPACDLSSTPLDEIPQGNSSESSTNTGAILYNVTRLQIQMKLLVWQNYHHDSLGEPESLLPATEQIRGWIRPKVQKYSPSTL